MSRKVNLCSLMMNGFNVVKSPQIASTLTSQWPYFDVSVPVLVLPSWQDWQIWCRYINFIF